jgi:hypothetical protein
MITVIDSYVQTRLPEWRKKQLFALATFFCAFEGENWNKPIRERWMDDTVDECLWFSSDLGLVVGGDFVEWQIYLGGFIPTETGNNKGEFKLHPLSHLRFPFYIL